VIHRLQHDAIDRANFQARLAASAIVGIDDRHFLGQFFAGTLLGHIQKNSLRSKGLR
jgi:hypothetical protein